MNADQEQCDYCANEATHQLERLHDYQVQRFCDFHWTHGTDQYAPQ